MIDPVWATLGLSGLGAVVYVLRMEGQVDRLKDANTSMKELLEVHLANIDQRLARIEKKVLNGDH